MDKHEQLNRDAARMAGVIEKIIEHERNMKEGKVAVAGEDDSELLDIPEVDEESL